MEVEDLVSLANLGRGGAIERFDDEFQRALDNVLDPNTGESARTVTLKVKLKPNADRTWCKVDVSCSASLASAKPFETQIFVGKQRGKSMATEYNPQQLKLPVEEPTPIRAVGEAGRSKPL
jgi:hypothetical protein